MVGFSAGITCLQTVEVCSYHRYHITFLILDIHIEKYYIKNSHISGVRAFCNRLNDPELQFRFHLPTKLQALGVKIMISCNFENSPPFLIHSEGFQMESIFFHIISSHSWFFMNQIAVFDEF